MKGDVEAFRGLMVEMDVDAIVLVPGPNFARFLGRAFPPSERPILIVIPLSGRPAAIVPRLELRSFELANFDGVVFDWADRDGYDGAFEALARELPIKTLAVEGLEMRVFVQNAFLQAYPGLRVVDAEQKISSLRVIKTDDEIAAIEEAVRISEAALSDVLAEVRVGMLEKQIEHLLSQALFAHGADDFAFHPIVAAGDNSARPHASARRDYRIQVGDALLLDFGARWNGLCADMTRTVFVGHASDEARKVYETVLRANVRGHEIAQPGRTAHEIDDAVMSVLEASAYRDRLRHDTGHGLGRAVHEDPYIRRGNDFRLAPGMVFTVEPGLYRIGELGIRIEDDLLITPEGNRSLTTFRKELTIVG